MPSKVVGSAFASYQQSQVVVNEMDFGIYATVPELSERCAILAK
jgi:hypothetical protein